MAPALAIVQHHLRNRGFPEGARHRAAAGAAYPNDVRAVEMLARAQMASGDTQQAISSLNKLAGLRPQSTVPLLMLADVHRGAKDNAAAEQALRRRWASARMPSTSSNALPGCCSRRAIATVR
ncbi:tetratricopeptide repeat protein [Thauera humireducens]|uniref:tetratricopeptide repeat protein n=1 Tax=Thauera humireducens TaxID=1134435 RepID=UPI003C78AF3D